MSQEPTFNQQGKCLQRSITLPNNIETIPQLNELIDIMCEEVGLDMAMTMNINLAVEEAVVNVMSYAYPNSTGNVQVDIKANPQTVVITLTDSGIPFDPTKKSEVDTTLSVEERPIGGLGIHLVRQIMDSIRYERSDNQNILTLEKNIGNQ